MDDSQKIDVIFSKVSRIETHVAVIVERNVSAEKRLNSHEGKIAAIEEVVAAYKIERAKLIGMAVASGAIFAGIGSFVLWISGFFTKHN
mgnify:CR=1 FL=1